MTLATNKDLRNRLRTAQGQLDAVMRMVDADAYCPDVMKQLSAVQGLLEGSSRIVLRNHLETCVAKAMQDGRTTEIVDELMEAMRFDRITNGPERGKTGSASKRTPR